MVSLPRSGSAIASTATGSISSASSTIPVLLASPLSPQISGQFECPLEDIVPPSSTTMLCLDLFTGMDGLGHALDILGLASVRGPQLFTILFETDSRCRRLLAHHRSGPGTRLSSSPDSSGAVGSVFALVMDSGRRLKKILSSCEALRLVLVGFSRANHGRSGALEGVLQDLGLPGSLQPGPGRSA